uniref:Uncharacterized protein n=1 Tax=Mycena chlorophos TaxID=658473 RepID=A0ABQ0LA25_MYCCL|nr:predicted protein [Mycena chlorophos]
MFWDESERELSACPRQETPFPTSAGPGRFWLRQTSLAFADKSPAPLPIRFQHTQVVPSPAGPLLDANKSPTRSPRALCSYNPIRSANFRVCELSNDAAVKSSEGTTRGWNPDTALVSPQRFRHYTSNAERSPPHLDRTKRKEGRVTQSSRMGRSEVLLGVERGIERCYEQNGPNYDLPVAVAANRPNASPITRGMHQLEGWFPAPESADSSGVKYIRVVAPCSSLPATSVGGAEKTEYTYQLGPGTAIPDSKQVLQRQVDWYPYNTAASAPNSHSGATPNAPATSSQAYRHLGREQAGSIEWQKHERVGVYRRVGARTTLAKGRSAGLRVDHGERGSSSNTATVVESCSSSLMEDPEAEGTL